MRKRREGSEERGGRKGGEGLVLVHLGVILMLLRQDCYHVHLLGVAA